MITDLGYLNISALTFDKLNISEAHQGMTIGYILDNVVPTNERGRAELAALYDPSSPYAESQNGGWYHG